MAARRFVMLCALFPAAAVAGFIWQQDPFQHFRAHDRYFGDLRYLAPGVARHHTYDTVILGDSHAQNMVPGYADNILGERVINLAISGSTVHTQAKLARLAINHGADHVIWGFNYFNAKGQPDRTRLGAAFPHYLYDDNGWNDLPYLFNLDTLKMAYARFTIAAFGDPELAHFNSWFWGDNSQPGRARALEHFTPSAKLSRTVPEALLAHTLIASFEANILATVRAHPETRFSFFIPPHSVLLYANMMHRQPAKFAQVIAFMRHVATTLAEEPNATLHYFDHLPQLTHELENYKDPSHFSLAVSNTILVAIGNRLNTVTPDNAGQLIDRFIRNTAAFDYDGLVAQLGKRRKHP